MHSSLFPMEPVVALQQSCGGPGSLLSDPPSLNDGLALRNGLHEGEAQFAEKTRAEEEIRNDELELGQFQWELRCNEML